MKSSIEIFPHNKEAYERVYDAFLHTNKTCVIQPTGTGKMYIAMQLIDDNIEKKILYLTSYSPILSALAREMEKCEVRPKNLTTALYYNLDEDLCAQQFDYIIIDEFHRAGARIWGTYVNLLLENNPQAKVLGLSATPIRHLDDGRDMSDELFDGNVASYMTLAEAVGRGLLKMPQYVCAIYSLEDILKSYETKIKRERFGEKKKQISELFEMARRSLDQAIGLSDIFNDNMSIKNGRYIVFCRNYAHMDMIEGECHEWFKKINPNIKLYDVRSSHQDTINESVLKEFVSDSSDKLKLLFTVDMLNEGVHIDNIDGCIMLRPTESANIFIQQLGRVISVASNTQTVVFDVVNNITQMESFSGFRKEVERISVEYGTNIQLDDFQIHESILEFKRVIAQIDDLLAHKGWYESYEYAKKFCEKNGHLRIPIRYKTEDGHNLGDWIAKQRSSKKKGNLSAEQITLLEKIGMIWNADDNLTWGEVYKIAETYYKVNGNLRVNPLHQAENGYNLGTWILKQRALKKNGKLSAEQIILLENIGMIWDAYNGLTWEESYKLAEEYYKANGNLRVNRHHKTEDGYNLGRWITRQRTLKKKGKLTAEQIVLLENIGMIWVADTNPTWEEAYMLARDYYKANGNLCVPTKHKTEDGYNLGSWISRQRALKKNGKLSEEQIVLLENIGMIWDAYNGLTWEESYKLAEEYYKANGNLRVNRHHKTEDGYNLGRWITRQRTLKKKGKLTAEQIVLLENIGMIWVADTNPTWEEVYKIAEAYYKVNGNLRVSVCHETENGYNLGTWILKQRALKKNGKLSAEQITLLEKIGMIWNADNNLTWEESYKIAETYYKTNGNLRVNQHHKTEDGYYLGRWILRQRTLKKKGKLSPERIVLLEKIGMIWNADNNLTWEESYKIAETYYKVNGNLRINSMDKDKNEYKLSSWIRRQRVAKKKGNLTPERIALLDKIGMVW